MRNKKSITLITSFLLLLIFGVFFVKAEIQSKTLSPNEYWGLGTNLESGDTLYFQITSPSVGVNVYIMNDAQILIYQNDPQDLATNYIYQWTGYYLLTYSFNAPNNQQYWVLIINPSDSSSTYVTIDAYIVKTITINTPISTDTFSTGYNYITWTSTGSIDYVQIDLYKNGAYIETLSYYTDNDGSVSWYIYDDEYTDGSYYQIKISDYDDDSIYDYSDYFTIETEIKTITITSPISTDTFSPGYNYITWTSIGNIDYVQIDLYKDGVFLETLSYYTDNDGSYSWIINSNDAYDGSNYQIVILDYNDNSIYDYSYYFTIEPSDVYIQPIFLSVLLSIIILAVIVVLTIVGVLIYRRRKQIIPISRDVPVKEGPVKSQEKVLPRIIYCSSCGTEALKAGDFCSECGASIK